MNTQDNGQVTLEATLHREADGTFAMYFCRGDGRCTKPRSERMKMSRLHQVCSDCVKGKEDETLEELATRIQRGDA